MEKILLIQIYIITRRLLGLAIDEQTTEREKNFNHDSAQNVLPMYVSRRYGLCKVAPSGTHSLINCT